MHPAPEHITLFLFWALWCSVHSLLISATVTHWVRHRFGRAYKFYRLAFNLFALLTVMPLAFYTSSLQGSSIFAWEGWLRLPQLLLIVMALWYFVAGSRVYDLGQLIGTRQILSDTSASTLSESDTISTEGILGVVRHPWYAGTLILIWARDLDTAGLTLNTVLSVYLLVGTWLEERKLLAAFGKNYRNYQQQVSMFFPWKYIRGRLRPGRTR